MKVGYLPFSLSSHLSLPFLLVLIIIIVLVLIIIVGSRFADSVVCWYSIVFRRSWCGCMSFPSPFTSPFSLSLLLLIFCILSCFSHLHILSFFHLFFVLTHDKVSSLVSADDFKCLKSAGYTFAVMRVSSIFSFFFSFSFSFFSSSSFSFSFSSLLLIIYVLT